MYRQVKYDQQTRVTNALSGLMTNDQQTRVTNAVLTNLLVMLYQCTLIEQSLDEQLQCCH